MSTTRPSGYDERHSVPSEANRRGAHRARPNPILSALPVAAIAVVVLAVIGGAWVLLGSQLFAGSDSGAEPASVAGASQVATPAQTPTETQPPTPTATPAAKPTTSAPAATVDKNARLTVLNATTTTGLGKRVADKLIQGGWRVPGTPANYTDKTNAPPTTVFYARASQRATAQAVAKFLGDYKATRDAAQASSGITVVIGADYKE